MKKALDGRPEVVISREVLDELVLEGFRLSLLEHLRAPKTAEAPNPVVYGLSQEQAQAMLLACLEEDGVDLGVLQMSNGGGAELACWVA